MNRRASLNIRSRWKPFLRSSPQIGIGQVWLGRDITIDKIGTALLEQFQRDRLKVASLSTVIRELGCLLRLLRKNGFHIQTPEGKPGRVVEQRELTDDELIRFFSHCEGYHKTLFLFLLATGARPAEVIPSTRSSHVALLKSEVLPEENAVLLRSAKVKPGGPKGKIRKIVIPEPLMTQIVEQARQIPGPHVFRPNCKLNTLFDRICVAAGIAVIEKVTDPETGKVLRRIIHKTDELGRKVTAHSFRHTYATKLAKKTGGDQFILKATLGHSQIRTTERYSHVAAVTQAIELDGLCAESA